MNNKTLGATAIYLCLASVGLSNTSHAARCGLTSNTSNLALIDNDGGRVPLKKKSGSTFLLTEEMYEGRNLHFTGSIKKTDPEDDFMVVIKIRGKSKAVAREATTVRLVRPRQGKRDRGFSNENYSLKLYSKHHFPDENNGADDATLKNKFHTPYQVAKMRRYTDDSYEKKRLFQFDGVGNKWEGTLLSRLFNSNKAIADTTPKAGQYVYLQAEIHNLGSSPCFEFTTRIPREVDDLQIQVLAIDADQRSKIDTTNKKWVFAKEAVQ